MRVLFIFTQLRYRAKSKKTTRATLTHTSQIKPVTSSALTPKEKAELAQVSLSAQAKLLTRSMEGDVVIAGSRGLASSVGPRLRYYFLYFVIFLSVFAFQ